jgi:hypothetical protein
MSKSLSLVALLLCSSPALAGTTYYSGGFCRNTDTVLVWGANNWQNSNEVVFCPATWDNINDGQVQAATLVYDDGSSASFNCWIEATNWDGIPYYGPSLYSCSQYGGCNQDEEPGYEGVGQLNFSYPFDNIGFQLYPLNLNVECIMPGTSIVHGYNFTLP